LGLDAHDEVSLSSYPAEAVAGTIIKAEGSAAFDDVIRGSGLDELPDPGQRRGLRAGLDVSAADYLKAMRIRAAIQAGTARLFRRFDVLLEPTYLRVAPPNDAPFGDYFHGDGALGAAGNLCGLPAISVPMGFGRHGLPLGLCIVGDAGAESVVLSVARAYQEVTTWHRRRPPLDS
jgi:aspartyl-tRNA(Asn)/glutamyl-tRNA(Gln) amidotransferase subunit A